MYLIIGQGTARTAESIVYLQKRGVSEAGRRIDEAGGYDLTKGASASGKVSFCFCSVLSVVRGGPFMEKREAFGIVPRARWGMGIGTVTGPGPRVWVRVRGGGMKRSQGKVNRRRERSMKRNVDDRRGGVARNECICDRVNARKKRLTER